MFNSSYRITRIWGIPIKVHISLIILLILLVQDYGIVYGMLVALGLLVSIVLHELGHSIVAIKKGCRVREITLMFMGGAAQMDQIPTKPLDEFLMALAGPAVSFAIGAGGLFGGNYFHFPIMMMIGNFKINIIHYIGIINLVLVVFNLLPAFPMDGGRILRAMLTPKLGRLKATFYAARLGKIMAILFGLLGLFSRPVNFILIVIAVFIYTAAGNEYRMVQMQEAAKTYGFGGGGWPPFGTFWSSNVPDEPEDKVIISPPPYKDGPDSEADLRTFRKKNPFSDLFGQ
ncbi:MAG: site-2 protease family protein [Kiritimatiellae bacterium]|nr:site-2 protease family protein [Kiritimatiellia bacterium]MDD5522500.1 site-2 protease family protein [Kiritimatiellia bacterium]